MRKIFTPIVFSVCLVGLFSCSTKSDDESSTKKDLILGGTLRLNETEYFENLNPLEIQENSAIHIGSQMYEGLVKFDPIDLSIKPAIARSYEPNADLTVWTFHLRSKVLFHDDACFKDGKGRDVNAIDVKYCFDKLCSYSTNNSQFEETFKEYVTGAYEANEVSKTGKAASVSGVKITNDSTIEITLKKPFAGFLNILTMPGCWIYPQEAVTKYGAEFSTHPVGSGSFYLSKIKKGESLVLLKNSKYYGVDKTGNKLPYLDQVNYTFISDKKAEILEFKSGNIDMVYNVPFEIFHDLMGDVDDAKKRKNDFQIFNSPALKSTCLGFNLSENSIFNKKELRLAFNYAIDRKKISEFVFKGDVAKAEGIVPMIESFEKAGYDYKSLKTNSYDVAKAQEYLKLAGYPNGKGFPRLKLQTNIDREGRNLILVQSIKKMLKENLNIEIEIVTSDMHYEAISKGEVDFFRYSWTGDAPDPENFLRMFYGKNVFSNTAGKVNLNLNKFNNSHFDSLLTAGYAQADQAKRFALLSRAEKIIVDEVPSIPIFYDENLRLERSNIKNFPENAINFIDLSVVHITPAAVKK